MQPGLIQALMNALPSGMEGISATALQADGTLDFAAFLQSMLPALEQQLEGMPPEARASLMAEFQREIHHAETIADLQGPKARVLDALLGAGKGDSGGDAENEPAPGIEQLLAMLGDAPRQPAQERPASTDEEAATDMLMAVGVPLSYPPDSPRLPAASAPPPLPAGGEVTMGEAAQLMVPEEGAGPDVRQTATPPAADMAASPGLERQEQAGAMRMAQVAVPGVQTQDVNPSSRAEEVLDRVDASPAPSENASAIPSPLAADQSRPRVFPDLPLLERIPVPVYQQREFGEAVGQRVMLMLGHEMQGARIELNPADLGPMEIHLHLRGNDATVHFGVTHALTREVIEAALPRLREMLAEQGFTQVNVNVGQQGQNAQSFDGQGGQPERGGQGSLGPWGSGQGGGSVDAASQNIDYRVRPGGLDLFA